MDKPTITHKTESRIKLAFSFLIVFPILISAQEVIPLPHNGKDNPDYPVAEREYYSKAWETEVITNVSVPAMEVFRPDKPEQNGMAVIIAPGGGYYALSIESEGRQVARWLKDKGVTAFVLKYRLVPTGTDGVADLTKEWDRVEMRVKAIQPLAQKDGLNAIKYVREQAETYGIDPRRIGFMGFSAGGDVTVNVGMNFDLQSKPDFIVPIYPWLPGKDNPGPPENAPPILVICATDDPLQLAPMSVALYQNWRVAGHSAAMIMYSRGGHGFGMRPQGLPSDNWIAQFYDWAQGEGLTKDAK